MSNNIDAKYNTLGLFNYVGVQEDRELQFYNSYGITSTNIRDAENEFLGLFGYASGSVTDRWDGFLRSRGFTGSVDDMLVKFWELATASLDLNFVNNNYASSSLVNTPFKNKSFNDAITFSRGTNATYVDSLGNIAYAPSNLLTYSEQFDNAAWSKFGTTTVSANTTIAPNGEMTADSVAISVSSGIFQSASTSANTTYTVSIWVRGDTPQTVQLISNTNLGEVSNVTVNITTAWQRVSLVKTTTTGTSTNLQIANSSTGATFQLWGAQLNLGTLQPYNSTTVKNLLGYTQDFDNAAWTKSNSSITQNVITAPDGSLTADKLVPTTATSTHYVFQSVSSTVGTTYTYSTYLKQGEYRYGRIERGNDGAGAFFDLQTGTVGGTNGLIVSSAITSVGNGWYRCSIVVVAATSSMFFVVVSGNNVADIATFTGDGTSGIYIWGVQLSDSASLDPYSYNFTTAPTAAAYYGPRFDYDPTTLACKGLLIEEQRTNSIRNNTMQGAVAGTPGTLPTNWLALGAGIGTLTQQIVNVGSSKGINYIDVRISGTSSTTSVGFGFDAFSQIAALVNQSWTSSLYLAYVAGTTNNLGVNLRIIDRDLIGGNVGQSVVDITSTISTTLSRFFLTRLLTSATTAAVSNDVLITFLSGAAIDITLRIGLPQLELGAFATSVIPTTTTAVTRAADVAVIQGANFSNWYNQSEGTLYAEISSAKGFATANNFGRLAAIQDPLNNNSIEMFFDGNANQAPRYRVRSGGANQVIGNSATAYTANTFLKASLAYAENNFAGVSRGVVDLTDTSGVVPVSPTFLSLGSEGGNINYLNGHIARIAYYPRRLADTDLVRITK